MIDELCRMSENEWEIVKLQKWEQRTESFDFDFDHDYKFEVSK